MAGELIALSAVALLAVAALGTLAWALGGWRRADVQAREMLLSDREADLRAARYEAALQRDRVDVLHHAADRLGGELGDERLAATILELLLEALHAPAGTLHIVSDDIEIAPAIAARGLAAGVLPAVRRGEGPAGRAWRDGRPATGAHDPEPEIDGPDGRLPAGHEAALPLRHGDRTLAVARVYASDDRGFSSSQIQTAERVATIAALALAHREIRHTATVAARLNRTMLDATPDALALLDADGRVLLDNAPMRALGAAGAALAAGAGDGAARREEVLSPSGDGLLLRLIEPVADDRGVPLGEVVVLRDITGERQSERLKDEFFALVSHELRTPLTSIIGYLDLLLDDGHRLDADTQRFLEVVQRNARRLLRLVGDVLFVAQVEAGRLRLERSLVDLGEVAAEAVESARPRAGADGVQLILSAEPGRPLTGDRDRFGQMLDNLIGNAVKFSPDGGEVEVVVADEGDDAVLIVRDTGMGIPAEDLAHLFERFYRSSDATRRAVPGVGLGLTIVKAIVDAHHGTIDVTSTPGQGTAFRVALPYGATADENEGADELPPPQDVR